MNNVPVIAIDGPSASGKGTVAQLVAAKLGFHYLDSGALYRIVAFAALQQGIAWHNAPPLAQLAENLNLRFEPDHIILDDIDITEHIRQEKIGLGASEVAQHPSVREALLHLQHHLRQPPGLVADGRDMASVVFQDAILKIYLTASVETRAQRRYQQYLGKGLPADYAQILEDLRQRDLRDSQRNHSPLKQTEDALLLDTTHRTIDEAVQFVLDAYKNLV